MLILHFNEFPVNNLLILPGISSRAPGGSHDSQRMDRNPQTKGSYAITIKEFQCKIGKSGLIEPRSLRRSRAALSGSQSSDRCERITRPLSKDHATRQRLSRMRFVPQSEARRSHVGGQDRNESFIESNSTSTRLTANSKP